MISELDMVVHTYSPSTAEPEAWGLCLLGQPEAERTQVRYEASMAGCHRQVVSLFELHSLGSHHCSWASVVAPHHPLRISLLASAFEKLFMTDMSCVVVIEKCFIFSGAKTVFQYKQLLCACKYAYLKKSKTSFLCIYSSSSWEDSQRPLVVMALNYLFYINTRCPLEKKQSIYWRQILAVSI